MITNSDHTMDDTSNPSINKPENISLKNNETYNPTEPIIATMTLISNINVTLPFSIINLCPIVAG